MKEKREGWVHTENGTEKQENGSSISDSRLGNH